MIGAYIINPSKETYTISELAQEYLNLSVKAVEELAGKGKALLCLRTCSLTFFQRLLVFILML